MEERHLTVHCPGCNASYFVDEAKIPERGGRLTCTSCATKWTIYRPGTGEFEARGPEPIAAPPAMPPLPQPEPAAETTARKEHTSISSSETSALITCPKCGHGFVPARRRGKAPPGDRRVVLLVEDQKYFTELTREALGAEYRTVSVSTKDEAMKIIETEPPSLMILDLSLARGQDGRDLLRSMPEKQFPILIFTARDETELYGEAWNELKSLGADDIVHKGMNVGDELRRKVASLLKGS